MNCFQSISISMKTHLFLLFSCISVISMAQSSFSNQTITVGEDVFMPYCRGEVHTYFEGEMAQIMEEIYESIALWDTLNPPKGFEANFNGRNNVLDIIFASYLKQENSKTIKSGAALSFCINDPVSALGSPVVKNIFLQPKKVADFFGHPVYQNTQKEVTVISKNKTSLFFPVTQEEYLEQLIEVETIKQNNNSGNLKKNDSDEILSEMENAYKKILKTDSASAAEFKTEIQKFKAEMVNNPTKNISDDMLTSLKKELEQLSSVGRNKPAIYSLGAMEKNANFSGLMPDEENGTALVKVAPEFLDMKNKKNALKLLVITWNVGANNSMSDKPRLFDGEVNGFGLADFYMVKLYHQQKIWNNIFNLIQ